MHPVVSATYSVLPIPLQNLLCTVDGYRRHRQRFTAHFHKRLAEWEETIHEPMEAQHARQWEGLRSLIERAREHVPYYRFLPEPVDYGSPEESIRKNLEQIPPLEKSVYRARSRDFVATDMPRAGYVHSQTSGTTGTALRVYDSLERFAENYAAVWRQRRSFGVDLNDPFFAFTGGITTPLRQQGPPFWRIDHFSRRTLFSVYHMSRENMPAYIDQLFEAPGHYAEGYPSALHLVSLAMLEQDRCLPAGRLRAVFTSSESLLSFQRDSIERAFGAPVRDHYASTEHLISMTACAENRLHVDMEFGIAEVIPAEETDEWVRGPLLVTGLGRPAAPMIRYRIGDVGTKLKAPCSCGRPGDVFLDIDGRIEDYVMTPERRLVGRMDHVFKGRFDIAEAQILQDSIDAIDVHLVPASDFTDDSIASLVRAIRARVGQAMKVNVEIVGHIPREPNGKFRAVKSTVGRLHP